MSELNKRSDSLAYRPNAFKTSSVVTKSVASVLMSAALPIVLNSRFGRYSFGDE